MRKALALIALALLVFVGVAHAEEFVWTEDFQGEVLADYWQLYSDDYSDIGVVDDPTDPESGNRVLMVDTWYDGGMAYAEVLEGAVEGLDGSQEITASFSFYLDDSDVQMFTILGTRFTGMVSSFDFGDGEYIPWYSADTEDGDLFEVPVYEWINFEFRFTPESEDITTHQVYMNGDFMGEFENVPSFLNEGAIFFVGDDEEDGGIWGLAYWDDFQISGTAMPAQDPVVPEPGTLLSLLGGITGVGSLVLRRRTA